MRGLSLLVVFCVLYVNAVPPGNRVRRGFNNSGYGGDRGSGSGGGYYSDERDASVSRESGGGGGECDHEESNESREHTYGDREEYGPRHDGRQHGGGDRHRAKLNL